MAIEGFCPCGETVVLEIPKTERVTEVQTDCDGCGKTYELCVREVT